MAIRSMLPIFLTCLLLHGTALHALAGPAPRLQRMNKQDSLVSSHVVFSFSTLPEYRLEPSGQRIDLFFKKTETVPNLRPLAEDDKIVRVLLGETQSELMVSLLLRQVPANITATAHPANASLALELFWQEGDQSRPSIAFRISGMPTRQPGTGTTLPRLRSDYTGRWHEFFLDYRTPLYMQLALDFSLPTLPRHGLEELPESWEPILQSLEAQQPAEALQGLRAHAPENLDAPWHAAGQMLHAEALLRKGDGPGGQALLDTLPEQDLSTALRQRAGYLNSLALVMNGDPFGALARRGNLEKLLGEDPYRVPFDLLWVEVALSNGDGELALDQLQREPSRWPEGLQHFRLRRLADARVLAGQPEQALDHYRTLLTNGTLPDRDLFSSQLAARAFLETGHFESAQLLYQQLSERRMDTDARSEALYLRGLATYLGGNRQNALLQFRQLIVDLNGTRGALRAWLTTLDHFITTREERHLLQGLRDYPVILALTEDRHLREEVFFKEAITRYLRGEHLRAIDSLGQFRRIHASSTLRREAESLMVEILQPEIEALIGRGEDLQAVVLLERYRDLLIQGDGQWPFLPQLAKAFTRLGLFERGCRVYLFLLDNARCEEEAKTFYLPLACLYFDRDEFALSERYARYYLEKYPDGKDRQELFLLQLTSLQRLERLDDAADLLQQESAPHSTQIDLLGAQIHWQRGAYEQVVAYANRLGSRGEAIPPAGLLLKAEALRRLGRGQQALPLYEVLLDDGTFRDQAAYRCGQLLLARGARSRALKLFQDIAEKGEDSLWRRLARDQMARQIY